MKEEKVKQGKEILELREEKAKQAYELKKLTAEIIELRKGIIFQLCPANNNNNTTTTTRPIIICASPFNCCRN